jgi:hypothetical protein
VRVLCRHGFLEPVPDDGGGRRYQRKASAWPPPAKYLNAGPIGFVYYLQTWFRYYLQQHIEHSRGQIETKEGVYSIDFGRNDDDGGLDGDMFDARGSLVECSGTWWDDITDSERQNPDLSQMNLAWVAHTEDPLFADFSRADRMLLYLVFTRECTWEKVADAMQVSANEARAKYAKLMAVLQAAVRKNHA